MPIYFGILILLRSPPVNLVIGMLKCSSMPMVLLGMDSRRWFGLLIHFGVPDQGLGSVDRTQFGLPNQTLDVSLGYWSGRPIQIGLPNQTLPLFLECFKCGFG